MMTGQTILHYRILEELGRGGMGVVYLAEDTKLERKVAIKFLPHYIAINSEERERFKVEAKAAAALNHPNIAHIYTIEEVDDEMFIVMEYIDGQELKDIIKSEIRNPKSAIDYATQIADGLQAAHEKGIIHRDIKSSNIMITKDDKIKIMDFGLAKVRGGTLVTKAGTTVGTVAYMSPEQTRGEKVDRRTDIWSFGVVIYEMITGHLPFIGEYDQAIIYSILNESPQAMISGNVQLPRELERIVNKALAKSASERYQYVDDMFVDLKLVTKITSKPMAKDIIKNRPQKQIKRTIPWAIVVLIICIACILWILSNWPDKKSPELIKFEYSLPNGYAVEDSRFFGSALVLSPNGKILVYSATDPSGTIHLYRRSIDQFNPTEIPGTEGAGNPFFSPNGDWVGFFAAGKLKKVSLNGGLPVNICDAQAGYGASWGTDENIIFSPTFTSGLLKVSATGGIPSSLTYLNSDKGELSHRWPEVLPDGKSVLYTVDAGMEGDAKHVAVYSFRTGEQRILIRQSTYARYADGYLVYIRGGLLFAVPFDKESLEVSGNEVKILEGIKMSGAGGAQYSISRNGTIVWVPSGNEHPLNSGSTFPVNFRKVAESRLLWIDRQGEIKPVINTSRGYWAPSISPDGQRIAVTIDLDIYILEVQRETLTRFTFEGRNHLPIWTKDGKYIIFSSARNGIPNLYKKKADGSGKAEKLLSSKQHQDPGSITPDGKILTYSELTPETNWDIWATHLGDSNSTKPFLQTIFNEYNPMISPDGHWLAYTSDESGVDEIYVKPFPTGDGKWLISTKGGSEPVWARDGSELFYRNSGKIMAAKIKTGSIFVAEKPQLLFERDYDPGEMKPFGSPNYDINPDGRFLIIESTPSTPSTQINFIINWSQELRRKS